QSVALFHVLRAAAVEVTVLLDELKWIGRPVFAPRLDDIQVANEENRLLLPTAMEALLKVFLALVGTGDAHVLLGKARGKESLCHGFGGFCDVADGIRCIDLNELLENRARF